MSRYDHIQEVQKSRYDVIQEITKFNPYHGPDGRFSSANGAASFTYKPGQGKMYDNAIAREKARTAAESAVPNPLGDPTTIAGVERGVPMSREKANSGHVNPEYAEVGTARAMLEAAYGKWNEAYNRNAPQEEIEQLVNEIMRARSQYNQAIKEKQGYTVNCQSCVVAYEARLRGYAVQTRPNTRTNASAQHLSYYTDDAWIDPSTGKPPIGLKNDISSVKTWRQAKQWIENTIQPGERYTFEHGWKGRSRTGHIISADKDSAGALRLYDPQSGKTYKGTDIDEYLSQTKAVSTFHGVKHPEMKLTRVDNMRINEKYADGIMEAAK